MAVQDLSIEALKAREAQIVGMIATSEARLSRGDRGQPSGIAVRGGRFVDCHSVESALNTQRLALETTRKVLADKLNPTTSEIAGNHFIGKRTAKGLVLKEIAPNGVLIGTWFVPVTADGLGQPKRMAHGEFKPCMGPTEVERVLFQARRHPDL